MMENTSIEQLLSFYMGKNTPDRQEFHQEFEGGVT
jgi:topoisomerase-4 subunit B